jgi:hypothetical protein
MPEVKLTKDQEGQLEKLLTGIYAKDFFARHGYGYETWERIMRQVLGIAFDLEDAGDLPTTEEIQKRCREFTFDDVEFIMTACSLYGFTKWEPIRH